MTSLYGSGIFYGSGSFYVGAPFSPDEGIPQNLNFYRTSQDGIYVFWWGFSPEFISPSLAYSAFDLQLDTTPLFNSPNLVTFTSSIDTTASLVFTVTSVVDSTHLVVSSVAGMSNGDNIRQGSNSATITTVGLPFTVVTVTDSTHLVVSSTTGMTRGDIIVQGVNTTTITTVIDSTHLIVGNTGGWSSGSAADISVNQLVVNSTTGWVASGIITFQNGNVVKGFAVPVEARQQNVMQTWYAQVRTHTPSYISSWSAPLTWTIPQAVQQYYAEALMESLPDSHVYGKGDLLKPVNQRNSNLYLVENMYGNQFDQVYYTNFLTQTDNYIDLCVDEDLYQNFGIFFNFPKPTSMQYVDYRWILINLIKASLVGSTNEAIILTVQAFTGVPPIITNIRDDNDFFLITVQDPPVVATSGQTVFDTSRPFVDSTFVLEQLSTISVTSTVGFVVGPASDSTLLLASMPSSFMIVSILSGTELLISPLSNISNGDTIVQGVATTTITSHVVGGLVSSSNYTTDGVRGTWTMNSPQTAGTVFQATFNIEGSNYPSPLVFDSLEGATALTGLVTFTNGSTAVSGFGTTFTTQLLVGQEITDPTGVFLGTVGTIIDNTHLTLTDPWLGPTEVCTAYVLQYTDSQVPPPILWDKSTLAFGVLITILNPGEFALN
jgi:hypothetical protein